MLIHDLTVRASFAARIRLAIRETGAQLTEVPAGTPLLHEGRVPTSVFWIADGLIRLTRAEPTRNITIGLRQAPDAIGFLAFLRQEPYRCTATAAVSSKVLRLSVAGLVDTLKAGGNSLSVTMEAMEYEFTSDLSDFVREYRPTAEQRLAALLARLGNLADDPRREGEIHLPHAIGRTDLADLVQAPPDRLDALLNALKASGRVREERQGMVFTRTLASPHHSPPPKDRDARRRLSVDARIAHAIRLIDEHYSNSTLDLQHVSRHLAISVWHLSRLFKQCTGTGFRQFLNMVRVEHARIALLTTDLSVKEIAAAVGYNQLSDLTRRFKALEGISPTAYRLRTDKSARASAVLG